MRSAVLGVAVLLLAASAAPAAAQRIDSPYRWVESTMGAGPFVGYLMPSKGPLGQGPEAAPALGARWGIVLTGPFNIELEAFYATTTRAVLDTSYTTPDSARTVVGDADMQLLGALANVRLNITGPRTWKGIQPYALFGGGAIVDLAGESAADTLVAQDVRFDFGTSFAGQLGAGFEWFASERWALRADARALLWKLKNPTAFRLDERGRLLPASGWESNGLLTAGVSYRF